MNGGCLQVVLNLIANLLSNCGQQLKDEAAKLSE